MACFEKVSKSEKLTSSPKRTCEVNLQFEAQKAALNRGDGRTKILRRKSCCQEQVNKMRDIPENPDSPTLPRSTSKRDQMSRFYLLLCLFLGEISLLRGELWEKDVTPFMKIGLSTSGFGSVHLRCGLDHFSVNITLAKNFQGVIYTRGSFRDKTLPCFKNHDQKISTKSDNSFITLRIPFQKCGTLMDVAASSYTNTVVLQHDPDLIMPGDAAFSLGCTIDPEFNVKGKLDVEAPRFKSSITLVDADPSTETLKANDTVSVFSKSDRVTLVSDAPRDEL